MLSLKSSPYMIKEEMLCDLALLQITYIHTYIHVMCIMKLFIMIRSI